MSQNVEVRIHFEGYRKLELEKLIDAENKLSENERIFVMRSKPGRANQAAVWKPDESGIPPFQLVFKKNDDGEEDSGFIRCMKCEDRTRLFALNGYCDLKSLCKHLETHNTERPEKRAPGSIKALNAATYAGKYGQNPRYVQQESMLPKFHLLNPADNNGNTTVNNTLYKVIHAQEHHLSNATSIGAHVTDEYDDFYQSSGSSNSQQSQETTKLIQEKSHNGKSATKNKELERVRLQIFRDVKCLTKSPIYICATYYSPTNSSNSIVHDVGRGATDHSRNSLNIYKPLLNDPWGRYTDTNHKDKSQVADVTYKADWRLVWQSPSSYESKDGVRELLNFRLALTMWKLAKARVARLTLRRAEAIPTAISAEVEEDSKIHVVASQFRMEYFHWETLNKWLQYFGVQSNINSIETTDKPEDKRHKENNLRRTNMDCHKYPENSLVCFERSHVPGRDDNPNKNEENQVELPESAPPKDFKYKLIYRIVVAYDDFYMAYVGVDDNNSEGVYSALVHSANDLTNYGHFRRDYEVNKSYRQALCYFHHPHPKLQLMSKWEWEGIWTLAHVLGTIFNIQFNYEPPDVEDRLGLKYFRLLNSRIHLPTAEPDCMEQLLMQAFRILFNVNLNLSYSRAKDSFFLDVSLENRSFHKKSIGSPRLSGGLWSFVQGVVGVLCDNIVSRSSIEVNLETLTSILHYIILDTDVDSTKSNQPTTESTIYSLLTSWLPQSGSHASSNGNNNVVGSSNEMSPKHLAKVNLLNEFGRVLNTLGFVWVQESNLRSKVIQLLNPIALTHMDDFVRATADVPTTDHIVDIILHLNVIRLANLTSSTITVISSGKTSKCINMLQLYSQYIGSIGSSLSQDLPMPLLIQLLRECNNLPPEGQNLLLVILNRVMCTFGLPPSITRQEVKELQECTQKLLEFISNNASPVELNKKRNSCANINECLTCLSNNLPGLLDIVWGSEDKDKLLPVLSHVVYLVFPHLKSKTSPTFEPATILFVNLTKFTHLKKAWKKEIFDHLIDPSFFRMSLEDFKNWLIILDNVFSQDKGSFSELIARATVPTSNSLNIFTSKETEYENRAMLLKRLAVVIYSSSNMDEYVKFITSIQERISESLKASATVIPNIQLSVFLLFRVLLVKLSVGHLTSLWPIIIHEISVVLSLLEQDLISSMNNIITADGRMEKPWNAVYSSVFKLLQEASKLPLFRMYSWNFTNNIIPRLKQHNNDLITAFEKIEEEQSSIEDDFIEV